MICSSLPSLRTVFIFAVVTSITGLQSNNAQDKISDNTSKVPKFSYASYLEGQEFQLKTNPLILRFSGSRKRMAGDRFRPIYHFASPESTLNDPNGLCYWNGYWHIFYQGYPPKETRQNWGHTISKDLIHWRDLPYAI